MALVILGPEAVAGWQATQRFSDPVVPDVAPIVLAVVTAWSDSGWPDLGLGCCIILLALHAAHEVWEFSEEERLVARALAGEID